MPSIALEISYFSKDCHFTHLYVPLCFADVGTCIKIFLEIFSLSLDFGVAFFCFFASYVEWSEQNIGVY